MNLERGRTGHEDHWQIPEGMSDEEILAYLDGINMRYNKDLKFKEQDAILVNDEIIIRFAYSESNVVRLRIARRKDEAIIVVRAGLITQRFSKPRSTDGAFLTGPANMNREADVYIGNKYHLVDARFEGKGKSLDLRLESTREIKEGKIGKEVDDFNEYLQNLAV